MKIHIPASILSYSYYFLFCLHFCIPSVYAKGILRSHIFFPYVRMYVRMFVRKFWEIVYNELLA